MSSVCERCLIYDDVIEVDKEYWRNKFEAKDWPDKRMPIALCEKHADGRKPLTSKQIDRIMNKIFPSTLLMLCLFVIGCEAQNLENIKTNLPTGSILQVGNGTVVPANPALFKGDKGDKGETGATGPQGIGGELIPPASAKDGDVLVVRNGKYVPVTIEINSDATTYTNLTGSTDLAKVIASTNKYYVSIAGEASSLNGSVTVYWAYTDPSGQPQLKNFIPVVSPGKFYPGLYLFDVKKDTEIKLYALVQGVANYSISFNLHQQ